jgi:hypothetical protein
MKTITHSLNGLASSLLLNLGLSRVAQKLDPVSRSKRHVWVGLNGGASYTLPCNFTPKGS